MSANHYVRHLSYRTFYLLHVALAPLLFPLLFLHVSHIRVYLLPSAALFAADQALKYYLRVPALATVSTPASAPGLLTITVTLSSPLPSAPAPGSHCLLRHAPTSFWTANPFTIVPGGGGGDGGGSTKQLRLVARVRSGFTRELASLAGSRPVAVTLDLPFGPPPPDLDRFDRVLLVAGGVGATFAVGWVRRLLAAESASVRFVWAVKTAAEAAWALDDPAVAGCVELFVTGVTGDDADADGIEMTEGLLAGGAVDALAREGVARDRIARGRPHLRRVVGETVLRAGEGRTAVLVCGPAGMAAAVKRAVARLGIEGRDVWLHVEEFGH